MSSGDGRPWDFRGGNAVVHKGRGGRAQGMLKGPSRLLPSVWAVILGKVATSGSKIHIPGKKKRHLLLIVAEVPGLLSVASKRPDFANLPISNSNEIHCSRWPVWGHVTASGPSY